MEQNPVVAPVRLRQFLQVIALAVGLGLFVFFGGKALGQISDRQVVEGRPMRHPAAAEDLSAPVLTHTPMPVNTISTVQIVTTTVTTLPPAPESPDRPLTGDSSLSGRSEQKLPATKVSQQAQTASTSRIRLE